MKAKDVVSFFNCYYEKSSLIISAEGGYINMYMGDGFFAIFGGPEPLAKHEELPFKATCRILEMSRNFILEGKPLMIGVGLHAGRAIMGNIGCRTK